MCHGSSRPNPRLNSFCIWGSIICYTPCSKHSRTPSIYEYSIDSYPPETANNRFTSVKYKVINDIIHIYDISTGDKIIQHEIDKRKGITVKAPELKKEPSDAWKAVATSLRVKYYSKSLDHFINGVCKEHVRYRFEQLKAIERFLDSRKSIDREFLEQVFTACCDEYAYSISGLESFFTWMEKSKQPSDLPMAPLGEKPISGVKVQQRGLESYAKAFRKLSAEHKGGQR